ncbi:unnamed protein product [Soboliphyme baturini]|uniref:BBSome complex member BBS5 n=1 Tax=Soboliphyme baturini TaxID=241478 RepID=A0A183ICB4_9BILA|nr:unnamed protein product [Soboliphyme baturini]
MVLAINLLKKILIQMYFCAFSLKNFTEYKQSFSAIGYNCITAITTKIAHSASSQRNKLRGQTEALCVLAKCNSTRFEFMFTCLNYCSKKCVPYFKTISLHRVIFCRAYDTTKLYREVKMRGSIIDDDQLKLLPLEEHVKMIIYNNNFKKNEGNLGSLVVTNVRIVWFAATNSYFNVSIPYLHIESKFGTALVIETSQQSGDFVFGFRVDPKERLEELEKEINNIAAAYNANPIFGIEFVKDTVSHV